ncbi:unnamed protein product [Notodromas monacha]|uniref:Alpha-ketoglutarate-dependent dioxygenase AlkB-like domain-containing protein n=1 Tax=Notodromas monacha TaxID=399045 RepID=A0A7R9BUR1_9CRUS|nr:unnamed protein product [Notodromas monacha]CAG0921070.1 unnamed protein product [Notodromas monacha]
MKFGLQSLRQFCKTAAEAGTAVVLNGAKTDVKGVYFHASFSDVAMKTAVLQSMTVHADFLTTAEEAALVEEVSPRLKRMVYETEHWDAVIHAFKETEWPEWRNKANLAVIDKVRKTAFLGSKSRVVNSVHVLELRRDGFIQPHVDSVRFCGETVAGLCCLSASVMRFRHELRPELVVDFLLPQRSLYVMQGVSRYEFTHEILKETESRLGDEYVPRDRRIAIICREPPQPEAATE